MEEQNLVNPLPITEQNIDSPKPLGFGKGFLLALSVIGAQIVASIFAALIALAFVGFDEDKFLPVVMGITMIISFPLAVWFVLRFRKLASSAWSWDSKHWLLLVVSCIMTFGTSWSIGVLMELLPNYEQMVEQYAELFAGFDPILLFVGGAIIGPVCEEIIFRGVILKEFLLRYDYKTAILLSAIIFSIIHMMPVQMISTFFVGIILGYIYYKTKSLWLVCIIHIVNNTIAFSMGTDDLASGETTREWFNNDLFFFGAIVLVLGFVYLMYLAFEKYHGPAIENETA